MGVSSLISQDQWYWFLSFVESYLSASALGDFPDGGGRSFADEFETQSVPVESKCFFHVADLEDYVANVCDKGP